MSNSAKDKVYCIFKFPDRVSMKVADRSAVLCRGTGFIAEFHHIVGAIDSIYWNYIGKSISAEVYYFSKEQQMWMYGMLKAKTVFDKNGVGINMPCPAPVITTEDHILELKLRYA